MNETIERIKKIYGEYYAERYTNYPEYWFTMDNSEKNNYDGFTIAMQIHEIGLLEMKKVPIWVNGSFIGFRIWFRKITI